MLGLKAKAGLLFFVSAGIFTGLVVFGNFIAPKKTNPAPDKQNLSNTAGVANSLQDIIGNSIPLPTETSEPPQSITDNTESNLTRNLASLIGKSIVDRNPEGPAGENLSVLGADNMADTAITESMKHFNAAYFSPEITQAEITVDNKQDLATYRAAVNQIARDAESPPILPPNSSVAVEMTAFAKQYETEAGELRTLSVPPALIAEHLKAIRIATGKQRIFTVVADYENDPIYAMLAIKLWDTLK